MYKSCIDRFVYFLCKICTAIEAEIGISLHSRLLRIGVKCTFLFNFNNNIYEEAFL